MDNLQDLRLLTNALRKPGFRFIVIGHNRKHLITDITAHLQAAYPNRQFLTLPFRGKTYRQIMEALTDIGEGIVFIPDFDVLFQTGNENLCTTFNQRRDALARLPLALLCFVEPSGYSNVPKRIPDWWSLRSLTLEFTSDEATSALASEFVTEAPENSSLGGQTKAEREAELDRLLEQLQLANPENISLIISLNNQIGKIYFDFVAYEKALLYWQQNLTLTQQIGDQEGEGTALNNISQIYYAKGDYDTALGYLERSLAIRQQIEDRSGEGTTLNNISQIYKVRGDYDTALGYLERSLVIRQQIGDRKGEGATLSNLAGIARAKGDYDTALGYLERSLAIQQQIGDRSGEGITLNNLATTTYNKGDYDTALGYLERSLAIQQQIGNRLGLTATLTNIGAIFVEQYADYEKAAPLLMEAYQILIEIGSPSAQYPDRYLRHIRSEIGEERFSQLLNRD
jgi:tetratricopeptide (TPR) repeat protein